MHITFLGRGPVATNLSALAKRVGHTTTLTGRDTDPGFADAALKADMVVLAIPYRATPELLPTLRDALAGKIVVDATNPLNEDWSPMTLAGGMSAAETIADAIPQSRMVKAFNTVFADIMTPDGLDRNGTPATTFIAGEDPDARAFVVKLAKDLGFGPVQVGPLSVARHLEALAHLNIAIAVGQNGGTQAAILYDKR